MRPEDKRLVADLMLLGDRLGPILDEVLAGQFDQDERRAFAEVLATIVAELVPGMIVAPAAESPRIGSPARSTDALADGSGAGSGPQ